MFPNTRSWEINLMAIDPGSSNLGIAIYRIGLATGEILDSHAFTLQAKDSNYYSKDYSNRYNDKFARLQALESELFSVFDYYRPTIVVCESPFFNSFTPNAYAILSELVNLIQHTLLQFNNHIPFYKVDPPTAKKAVGAKGNAKKEDMVIAIDKIKHTLKLTTAIETLDEHSIDALAIGYYGYLNYILKLAYRL